LKTDWQGVNNNKQIKKRIPVYVAKSWRQTQSYYHIWAWLTERMNEEMKNEGTNEPICGENEDG
jgi:hypothetical protein